MTLLTQRQSENKNWKLPPKNWIKVNVDAAVKMSDLQAGLGVVIRDSSGKIVSAAVQRIYFRGNLACMEAEAVLFGIQAAHQAKCVPFSIESNSLKVVDLSKNRKRSMAEISWTIKEIQTSLKNQSQSSIQFVPRLCNSIAHSIGKVALEYEHPVLWLDDFPARIL